jgi:ACR3 family arsenite transporter
MSVNGVNVKLPFFERYLTLWVISCIIAGVIIGKIFPAGVNFLSKLEISQVNIPVAVLIWLMIYPMMVQIDFSSIVRAGKKPKGLAVTLVVNWLIKPFTMAVFAAIFFKYVFAAFISPSLAKEYIAGAILLGAAPCTAMVFVWSYLTKGDPAYTLVQVAVNDLVILVAFVPIVKFLLGVNQITVPYDTLIYSTIFFVVIPLTGGYISRVYLLKKKGANWFENVFLKVLKPVTILGLLLTLIILFAFQGNIILGNPVHILLIAVPLTIQTYFIFAIGYLWSKKWRLPHSIAAPAGMIGASNFFELSVAVAISLFGLKSGAALATVVGVLTEVPIMLSLVNFSNKTRHWFEPEKRISFEPLKVGRGEPIWEKVLIATDLSKASDEVVDCIARYGKAFSKEAKLAHIISVETAGGIEETLEKSEKPIIETQAGRLKASGIAISYSFGYGIPFVEINRLIADERHKLLILGSHGKSMSKEILLGSVSDSIIRNLKIPALVIKCPQQTNICAFDLSGRILFPTDFSENAKIAFEVLASVAGHYDAKVTLYHVQDVNILFPHLKHKMPEFNATDKQRLDALKQTLIERGVKNVAVKLETGHAKQAIINEMNNNKYNLVVMGTQGRGWIEELFIGGVAHAVVRKSNSSLLLVPYKR